MKNLKELTLKQKTFAEEYLSNGGNATQAALKVYPVKNYNTAHAIASENLQKPTVQAYIKLKVSENGLSKELVLEKLLKALQDANPFVCLKACELLGKHLGMFSDKDPQADLSQIKAISWGR